MAASDLKAVNSAVVLGIDFGTSNSAMAARWPDGRVQALRMEGEATNMPTALFFNEEEQRIHYGRDAMACYLAGMEGRLMRSLKSLLGSALIREYTQVLGKPMRYSDIVALFMRELAQRAQAQLGFLPARVCLGRPVHFVDDDPQRDQQAEQALREAAQAAGFQDIAFEMEPIAAAFEHERNLHEEALTLVVDIGGGTSDFTLVRLGPARAAQARRTQDILATTGVHIGGTDFDRRLNLELLMPWLGFRHIGPKGREVPSAVFFDLATWHLIPWRYTHAALQQAQALRSDYGAADLHARLMQVLREQHGHRMSAVIEQTKIAVSQTAQPQAVPVDWLTRGAADALQVQLSPEALCEHLDALLAQVVQCAQACVLEAGLRPGQVDAIYLTGGSSALMALREALARSFVGTPQITGDLMGGVASGLALRA